MNSNPNLMKLDELKETCKLLNITINDLVMCSLSTSLKTLFEENGDSSTHFNLVIPANIRFKFYPTREKVMLENKFAGIPMTVPLTSSMQESYDKIKIITSKFKKSFPLIYASYALTMWMVKFVPR